LGVVVFSEDELLPISALQHLVFCERQWALIHLEQQWSENRLTAEGRVLHDKAHGGAGESRRDLRIARGLRIHSLRLGLTGIADVVEFHRSSHRGGIALTGTDGVWMPFPVEYKRGRPKPNQCDEIQLCAQALCLEEMLGVVIPGGALFYGSQRRRHEVPFDSSLRARTENLASRLHELTDARRTPPAVYEKKCESCSLINLCLPRVTTGKKSVSRYLSSILDKIDDEEPIGCDNF
jgi:CRISPR-associated exonuclease Cas4